MPFEYTIFPKDGLVLERFTGRVTLAELHELMDVLWADEAYQKTFDTIVDLTEAAFDLDRHDMASLTEFLGDAPDAGTGRVAILASKPLETALGFLFQSNIAMQREVAVFSTWASVREFLDLPASINESLIRKR
jgi:hypothetical protein